MQDLIIKGTKQTRDGTPTISFSKTDYLAWLKEFEDGHEVVITLSDKRSKNQNALFHKWVTILSSEIGYDFDSMKAWLVCKFFGCKEEEIDGKVYTIPISTSKLNKKQFAEGMTNLYLWASEQGFILPNTD